MKKLICLKGGRLGKSGAREIKEHIFFAGVDWENYNLKPCFVPDLKSETDTKYFDNFKESEPWWLP